MGKVFKGIATFVLGAAGFAAAGPIGGAAGFAAGSLLFGGKKRSPGVPQRGAPLVARRDDAAELAARDDELRRRRGSAADMILNGSAGAEAALAPGKLVLGA